MRYIFKHAMDKVEIFPVLDLSVESIDLINRKNQPKKINEDTNQFKLFDFEMSDLEQIIRLHISEIDINDSCSLFGGYALAINNQIKLYPQCCGLLEEIRDWKRLLIGSSEPIYLSESHPSPKITAKNSRLIIECIDRYEGFIPKTETHIELELHSAKIALSKLINNLQVFSRKLDKNLSEKFNVGSVAEKMIWGN